MQTFQKTFIKSLEKPRFLKTEILILYANIFLSKMLCEYLYIKMSEQHRMKKQETTANWENLQETKFSSKRLIII